MSYTKNFRFQIEQQTQFFFVILLIIHKFVAINKIDIVFVIILTFLSFRFRCCDDDNRRNNDRR